VSTFRQLVESRTRPIVTAEFPSIDGGTLDTVKAKLDPILPYVDAINATDNPAAHAHASNVSIAIALKLLGADPILQVVCRDKNRIAAQADVVGAALHGVTNVCALTGDDVTAGDEPQARRVFDLDGPQLVRVMDGLRQGRYVSGRKLDPAPDLLVGAVENPFAPPHHYRIERARLKSDAGARFLQLQIGYEPERLPSICLTKSAKALEFMHDKVPGIVVPEALRRRVALASDVAEESYQVALELAQAFLATPGVAGIHVTDFRHDGSLARLVTDLGLSGSASAA
jgi:methylenetetrahydrofolate reductase (NADPH)